MTWKELIDRINSMSKDPKAKDMDVDFYMEWFYLNKLKEAGEKAFAGNDITEKNLLEKANKSTSNLPYGQSFVVATIKNRLQPDKNNGKKPFQIGIEEAEYAKEFYTSLYEDIEFAKKPEKDPARAKRIYDYLESEYKGDELRKIQKTRWNGTFSHFIKRFREICYADLFCRLDKYYQGKISVRKKAYDEHLKAITSNKFDQRRKEYDNKAAMLETEYRNKIAAIEKKAADEKARLEAELHEAQRKADEAKEQADRQMTLMDENRFGKYYQSISVNVTEEPEKYDINKLTFSKKFLDSIKALREDRNAHQQGRSTQYNELLSAIDSFKKKYDKLNGSDGRETDEQREEYIKQLNDLIPDLLDLQKKASAYVNKRFSGHIGLGKIRSQNARNILNYVEGKANEIKKLAKDLTQDMNDVDNQRLEEFEKQVTEIKKTFDPVNKEKNEKEKALETAYNGKEDLEKAAKDLEVEKQKLEEEKQKLDGSEQKEQANLSEPFNTDALISEISHSIFTDEHNPVPDYKNDFQDVESWKQFTAAHPGKVEGNAYRERLSEAEFQKARDEQHFYGSYSVDALIQLANLRLMDQILGVKRPKRDYYVEYEYHYDGKLISGDEVRSRKDLDPEKLDCIITGVKSGRYTEIDPGIVKRESNNVEDGIVDLKPGQEIDADTLAVISMYTGVQDLTRLAPTEITKNNGLLNYINERITSLKSHFQKRGASAMMSNDYKAEWERINVITPANLKTQIVDNMLDLRNLDDDDNPALKGSEDYYDPKFIVNLKGINANFIEGAANSDALSDAEKKGYSVAHSMKISDAALADMILKPLFSQEQADPELSEILNEIKAAREWRPEELFEFKRHYIKETGETDQEPADTEIYVSSREDVSEYEKKAKRLHVNLIRYLKNHPPKPKEAGYPSNLLDDWRKKAFLEYPPFEPVAGKDKVVDATAVGVSYQMTRDIPDQYDGDAVYLLGTKFLLNDIEYNEKNTPPGKGKKAKEFRDKIGANQKDFVMKNVKDEPLFVKEPDASDFNQGKIGNCFFLASLSSIAREDPAMIHDMIRDNGDGTVTCRFYKKENNIVSPLFVKVNKSLASVQPGDQSSKELYSGNANKERMPLWAHLLQKAYCLSGLRTNEVTKENEDKALKGAGQMLGLDPKKDKEKIYDEIIRKVQPGIKDEELAKLSTNDKSYMFSCFMEHTQGAIWSGDSYTVFNALTGKSFNTNKINVQNFYEITKALDYIEIFGNKIFGDIISKLSGTDQKIMEEIGKLASADLRRNQITYSVDSKNHGFVALRKISLEKLEETIQKVSRELEWNSSKKFAKKDIRKVKDCLINGLRSFQREKTDKAYLLPSEKPGNYSKYAENIFEKIQKNKLNHEPINCDFDLKLDLVSELNDKVKLKREIKRMGASSGVPSEHAYAILDCVQEKDIKYVIIRNPWGHGERKETEFQFSDGEKVKHHFVNVDKEYSETGGVFRMELNEFIAEARSIDARENLFTPQQVRTGVATALVQQEQDKDPENFRQRIKGKNMDEVMEAAENSPVTENYCRKIMRAEALTQKEKDRTPLTKDEQKEHVELKMELKKLFGQNVNRKSEPAVGRNTVTESRKKTADGDNLTTSVSNRL